MSDEPQNVDRTRQVEDWYASLAADLPVDFTVLEAVVSLKCLDGDGVVVLFNQRTETLNVWEAIGMLVSAQDDLRASLQTSIEDD